MMNMKLLQLSTANPLANYSPQYGIAPLVGAALVSGASSLIGKGLSFISQKKSQDNAKEYFDYTSDRQEARQDYLNSQQYSIQKNAMQNAGMSTAALSPGAALASNATSGQAGGATMSPENFDISGILNSLTQAKVADAQIKNINEDTRGKEIVNDNASDYWSLTLDQMKVQLYEARETVNDKISLVHTELDNAVKDGTIKEKQAENIQASTDKVLEEIKGIKIDNKYKDELNEQTINKLKEEIGVLAEQRKFEQVKAKLAQHGIIIGADWMTQLLAISEQGSGSAVLENIMTLIKDAVSSLGQGIGEVINSCIDSLIDGATGVVKGTVEGAINGIKDNFKFPWNKD